ncbi:hypothetical protein NDI76_20945 [Halogeometricum sp. S1BR25-6]|uniref:Uncharacterized protein n=1 Tax=Halogeometricum salsisoli TaxID=2950536 RepID=A0ABU2GKA2_9EURY|nr:hypothetical protein [Halogeometricum sp. S1BR25-6]MDS0301205.1 hypothetical protein [Halogeometricum sp. S1BR25-6]
MAPLAFALGFTHNEEFDIIAIYTGLACCLDLILLYSLAVITSLVGVTLVLVAGYQRYEDRLEDYAEYLPGFTATILIVMVSDLFWVSSNESFCGISQRSTVQNLQTSLIHL